MDLKYITPTQTLQVKYEGRIRRFTLHSVSTRFDEELNSVDALARDLDGMGLDNQTQIWTASWESVVVVLEDSDEKPPTKVNILFPYSLSTLS